MDVVAEAGDGALALELARRLEPDLMLVDVSMPEMDGLQATRAIKRELPDVAVLVLTAMDEPRSMSQAIEAGAAGYVLKSASTERIIGAVRRTLDGGSPLNQELAMRLIRNLTAGARENGGPAVSARPHSAEPSPLDALTPQEAAVLRLVVRGQTNPKIARRLLISVSTVKKHVHRIMTKLGVSDRTQAAVRALRLGFRAEGDAAEEPVGDARE